jgi:hypothetical protein
MPAKITDTTVNPVVVPVGGTATPFGGVTITESSLPARENLIVVLTPEPSDPTADLGSLNDPGGSGSYDPNTHTFTAPGIATFAPTQATTVLSRLVYTPPTPVAGSFSAVDAKISVSDGVTTVADPVPVVLETVTAPMISGAVGNQPVASGASLPPFATVGLTDNNYRYNARDSATITLLDGGQPTDADGLLTGIGLSKTGTGAYALAADTVLNLQARLRGLSFAPTAVAAGASRTTTFDLKVTNDATKLPTEIATTSVLAIGPTPPFGVPPLIAGTVGGQTVAPGNAISPFNGVTVSDTNANPQVSATLTVAGGGTLTGPGLVAGPAGSYTVAATTPSALTAILQKLTFAAPPLNGAASLTSGITLAVADGPQVATDTKTSIVEQTPPLPPTPPSPGTGGNGTNSGANFLVVDQTTGQQSPASGDKYSGPVTGLAQQIVLVTPDNVNVTAKVPNVFIHTGPGTDGIDVSQAGGNNILDGSTGSNFLIGGPGFDTFYLDDRNPTSDVYSTVVGFHAGDNVSVFGVNATDFAVAIQDNQGAAGSKGLTYTFTAPGRSNASVVIAGYSKADLVNGRLTAVYGSNPDLPGQPGTGNTFLNIHGN